MDWVTRKGTTREVEPCAKLLEEEKISVQRAVSEFVSEQVICFRSGQALLPYVSPVNIHLA